MKKLAIIIAVLTFNLINLSNVFAQGSVYFESSPFSYIGYGRTYTSNQLNVGNGHYEFPVLTIDIPYFSLALVGPNRELIGTGMYVDAARAFFNGASPGMSLVTSGRGNNVLTGWFNVLEITRSGDTVTSTAIDFMQYDEGIESWWNFGSIRYNSSIPLTTSVPEPSTFAFVTLGAALVLLRKRR